MNQNNYHSQPFPTEHVLLTSVSELATRIPFPPPPAEAYDFNNVFSC